MDDELKELSRTERMKAIKERAEELEKEYDSQRKQIETCKKCWMVTYTGSVWYCPLPYCGR